MTKTKKSRSLYLKAAIIFSLAFTGLLVGTLVVGFVWSYMQERKSAEQVFNDGSPPNPVPNGKYIGHWSSMTNWQGKTFDAQSGTGINNFSDGDRYVFTVESKKSLHGANQVIRINYGVAGNPWWLKFIVDEITQVGTDRYQGKIYLRLFGSLSFTLGYFELDR